MQRIRFDYGNLLASRVEGGVDERLLTGALAERFAEAHAATEALRERGELGFFDLPFAAETVDRVVEMADGFGQWFEDVVVLGIGGSGLGAIALKEALLGPAWNDRSADDREHFPRLHIVDNPDPVTVGSLLDRLDPARTMFNVVSKSGATAETMAEYLVVREWIEAAVGSDKARGHFLFTTDPTRGALRQIAGAEDIPTLPVPENVGGRFSVLSPVGLFPAAVCGVDPKALLAGARDVVERCATNRLSDNPAGVLATLLHHEDTERGRSIHVLMPYTDRLRALALWFQQLWAESLGKSVSRSGEPCESGPTPLASVGASDQHSLMQLFIEGPKDKVVLFVGVDDVGTSIEIPRRHPGIPSIAYLGGHTLEELLANERAASAEALRRRGRPNATFHLPRVDEEALGQLLMLFQIATVYAGALYDVDPLNQPGVELGKRLTYGLMGREGVEVPELSEADPRWVL